MSVNPVETKGKIVALHPKRLARRNEDERAFLPAALEIIETPASPAGRWTMLTIVALVVIAVIWAVLGQIDIIATARGKIIPTGKVKLIQPLEIGVVKAIPVHDGDRVAAGQTVIEIDPTSNRADQSRVERDGVMAELDMARLDAALAGRVESFVPPAGADAASIELARQQLVAGLAELHAKLDGIDRQIAAKSAERDEAQATIAKLQATLPIIAERSELYEKLRQNEYTSKVALLDARRALVEAQHDLEISRHKIDESTAAIAALNEDRLRTQAEFRRSAFEERGKADQKAAEARQEAIKLVQKTGLQTLRAPVAGTVEQLAVHSLGGVVTPAETLMVIVPEDQHLEIEAMLPNREIGFVHAGQEAEVKVDAFTFTRYGLLHGVVQGVSRDAVAPTERNRQPNGKAAPHDENDSGDGEEIGAGDSPYVAHIAIDRTSIMTEQGETELGAGMSVVVEIKTGRRRVIDYLLSPLLRYQHDGLRER